MFFVLTYIFNDLQNYDLTSFNRPWTTAWWR